MKSSLSAHDVMSRVSLMFITIFNLVSCMILPADAQPVPSAIPVATTIDPDPIFGEEYILIRKDLQKLFLIKDSIVLLQAPCGTSKESGDQVVTTENGTYTIKQKFDVNYVSGEFGVRMPYALLIYNGVMIHGSYGFIKQKGVDHGLPQSHGCIRLPVEVATTLSSKVHVGTKVKIIGETQTFTSKVDQTVLSLYDKDSAGIYSLKILTDPSPENIAATRKAALDGKLLVKGPKESPERCKVGMPYLPESALISLKTFQSIVLTKEEAERGFIITKQ